VRELKRRGRRKRRERGEEEMERWKGRGERVREEERVP
jgi:hypothetical protein